MKARVKSTGEIIEVSRIVDKYIMKHHPCSKTFDKEELDFEFDDEPDYWTRLEHQYAGMAMQGLLSDNVAMEQIVYNQDGMIAKIVANFAVTCAHTLVEKLKSEEKK